MKDETSDRTGESSEDMWALRDPELCFSFRGHIGAIKAVSIDEAGEMLATGGDDEYIRLFNLITKKERGELTQHTGSITSLEFFRSSHLLSASHDGTVCIWRTNDWLCLHVLGGHKVNFIIYSSIPQHYSYLRFITLSRF